MSRKRKPLKSSVSWSVGDSCNYHSVIGGPVTSTGHRIVSIAIMHGRAVAWISGKTGWVAIEALSE